MSKVEDNLYVNSRLTEIFLIHSILKDKILKKLNINYPASQYEHEKIDVFDWQEFVENEPDRFPLHVAYNRAHLWPKAISFYVF